MSWLLIVSGCLISPPAHSFDTRSPVGQINQQGRKVRINASDRRGILECMFEQQPDPDAIARFDELFERHYPSKTPESAAMVERICSWARAENRAAAAQLVAIDELFVYRLSRCSETEDWAIDTMEAVAAEVGAALRISQGLAVSRLRYARAMRERLPKVAEVFRAGDIDYRMFQTIVYRTDLITDEQVLTAVDAQLAVKVPRWPSMSRGRLAGQVDKIVARVDADAVRRRQERQADRDVWIGDGADGHLGDSWQPVHPGCACSREAVGGVGGHGV